MIVVVLTSFITVNLVIFYKKNNIDLLVCDYEKYANINKCVQCSINTYTLSKGSTSLYNCLYISNYYGTINNCKPCPRNTESFIGATVEQCRPNKN